MSFSERNGYKEQTILEKESMNEDLKNSLWNVIYISFFQKQSLESDSYENILHRNIWLFFLKKPIETIEGSDSCLMELKHFYFKATFNEIYELVEFLIKFFKNGQYWEALESFINQCNQVLETKNSAYRIVDSHVIPITSDEEIGEIVIAYNTPLDNVNSHIKQALEHYSDRKNPDYRNSIKESISAVEAISRKITGESTLDRALNSLEKKIEMNTQLKEGLKKIYYWTNGKDGIRHASMDEPNISEEDARFMLISCSAFVNYLVSKALIMGIALS